MELEAMMNIDIASACGHLVYGRPQVDVQVLDGAAGGAHEVWMTRGVATIIAGAAAEG